MTIKDLARMIDDLDVRFSFVLDNLDAVRRMLQDSGAANFEKHCNALYASQMMFESISDELTCLSTYATELGAQHGEETQNNEP